MKCYSTFPYKLREPEAPSANLPAEADAVILLLVFFGMATKRRTSKTPLKSTPVIKTVNPEGTFRRKIDKTKLLWANDKDLTKTPDSWPLAYIRQIKVQLKTAVQNFSCFMIKSFSYLVLFICLGGNIPRPKHSW